MGQPVKRPRGRMVSRLWSRDKELSEVSEEREDLGSSDSWLCDSSRIWRLIRELKLS